LRGLGVEGAEVGAVFFVGKAFEFEAAGAEVDEQTDFEVVRFEII
jgi:hypothetical protein